MDNQILLLLGYFIVVNLICYFLMAFDKRRAELQLDRISESTLLFWALVGGALGGKIAQRRVRHKTRKQPFARTLNMWLIWNVIVIVLLISPAVRALLFSLLGMIVT